MRFCYINIANIYPQDIHLIDGLRALGHEIMEINEAGADFGKYKRIWKAYKSTDRNFDAVIVGFTCPHFVPLARLLTTNKIVFNAGSSQYEANIISRGGGRVNWPGAVKWYLVDLVSFHLPDEVLLESNTQIDFVNNFFLAPRSKLKLSRAGVDEKHFFYDPKIQKKKTFTVLFRGRFLPESGVNTVIEAAKLLENTGIQVIIIGFGFSHKAVDRLMTELAPTNVKIIKEKLPIDDLREKMSECHVSLGQMADHPRLERTLPCKLYETLALGLPYLTARNRGILELLRENETCVCANPGDPRDLADKIFYLSRNGDFLEKIAKRGHEFYEQNLTSKILAEKFLEQSSKNTK